MIGIWLRRSSGQVQSKVRLVKGVCVPHRAGHVPGRSGLDFSGHPVEALVQQSSQGPARAVPRQHVQVVNVEFARSVRLADLRWVHMAQPVIGGELAGHVQDQPAQRVALVRVGLHPPVLLLQVLVDRGHRIHQRAPVLAQPAVLLAVDDVRSGGAEVVRGDQRLLDDVLDVLHRRRALTVLVGQNFNDVLRGRAGLASDFLKLG
jgi:hypothetical protein